MKTKIYIIAFCAFLLGFTNPMKSQECFWSGHAGGALEDVARVNAFDREGNYYISGYTTSPQCYFQTDTVFNGIYKTKLNPEGHTIWASTIVPGVDGHGYGGDVGIYDLTVDSQSNIYVSGASNEETHFGDVIIPRGGFIAKYREDGTLVWAKQITRVSQYQNPYSSEAPPLNLCFQGEHLYVNGKMYGDTVKIDTILMMPGSLTFYLARFDPNGMIQGVTSGGGKIGAGDQITSDPSGNVYLTGIFLKPTGVFGHDTLHSEAIYGDCYITKINKNGEFIWTRQLFASLEAEGKGVAFDLEGNIYLSIKFAGDIQCGSTILTSDLSYNIALVKFSPDGECLGYRQYSAEDVPMLSIDREGNIGMAGFFKNSLEIGGNLFTSFGEVDIFAAKCAPITGIPQPLESPQDELMIYANPTTGQCNITIPEPFRQEKELRLQIYDQTGKLVQEARMELAGETVKLDIRAQAKGMYLAVLTNGKRSYSGKIVFE